MHAQQLNVWHVSRAVEARERSPCSHKRSHVPNDCRFFRAMSEHVIGVLLTAQMEIRSLVHDLPTMVSSSHTLFSKHHGPASAIWDIRVLPCILARQHLLAKAFENHPTTNSSHHVAVKGNLTPQQILNRQLVYCVSDLDVFVTGKCRGGPHSRVVGFTTQQCCECHAQHAHGTHAAGMGLHDCAAAAD